MASQRKRPPLGRDSAKAAHNGRRRERFSNPVRREIGGAAFRNKVPRTEPHPRQSDGKALNEQARTRGQTRPT
jgi:hypothetical protein